MSRYNTTLWHLSSSDIFQDFLLSNLSLPDVENKVPQNQCFVAIMFARKDQTAVGS